jgi:peptidoglycan hydrolase CwlO-like protein
MQLFDNLHQIRMNSIAAEDARERESINNNIKDEGVRARALDKLSKKTEQRERAERERDDARAEVEKSREYIERLTDQRDEARRKAEDVEAMLMDAERRIARLKSDVNSRSPYP